MRTIVFLFSCLTMLNPLKAQDSTLLSLLSDSATNNGSDTYMQATFKAIHIVNTQTIESPGEHDLNFIIMHRFGKLNDGAYNFFGLDNASIRLGLDYGLTDRLSIGIGRSSLDKLFDGYLKYKLLRQSENSRMPVSVSILGTIANYTLKYDDKPYLNARYRSAYTTQLLVARKINSSLSVMFTPTWLHFNLVPTAADNNDVFATVAAARFKVTKRMSITAEYNYLFPDQLRSIETKNSLSLGLDIETGGHVFQLIFSNSQGMTEPQYITHTSGSWGKGDIYFGFNVSRNFSLGKKKYY